MQVRRAYVKAEEGDMRVAVVARLDFEVVRPRYGELGNIEIGSFIVVAQMSGNHFGNQVLAVEQSVAVAVKRSNMNEVLAQCVVFKLYPMEERALGVSSDIGAVRVSN